MANKIKFNSKELLKKIKALDKEELERLISYHNVAYFKNNKPEITDLAFDMLTRALALIDNKSEILKKIGHRDEIKKENEIEHRQPMLSLDKCYTGEELRKWQEKVHAVSTFAPKIDGIACSLRYNEIGSFSIGASRGDGYIGENISANIKNIRNAKNKIKINKAAEIRGEIYLDIFRFSNFYSKKFSNTRNLAAGALKSKNKKKSASCGLSFLPYDIFEKNSKNEKEKFNLLKKLGFEIPLIDFILSEDETVKKIDIMNRRSKQFKYKTDGIVLKANPLEKQIELGETSHHPKFSIAYKGQSESISTRLIEIIWTVSRTGAVTPVAKIMPTTVSGALVKKASLHNASRIVNLNLKKGDIVEITRRGGIIPHVEKVLRSNEAEEAIEIPKKCPSCKSELIRLDELLMCKNKSKCEDIISSNINHFCKTLKIDCIGAKLIKKLVSEKILSSLPDVFKIKAGDIERVERIGPTLAKKIIKSVGENKQVPLVKFIEAIGLSKTGPSTAAALSKKFMNIENIMQIKKKELIEINKVGDLTSESIVKDLDDKKKTIKELLNFIEVVADDKNKVDSIKNKNFAITGKTGEFSREKIKQIIEIAGGIVTSSVSKNLDFLILGEIGNSNKKNKTEELIRKGEKIQILTPKNLIELITRIKSL